MDMTRFEQERTPVIYGTIALLVASVFVADLYTHLGLAIWIAYLLPVVLTIFGRRPVVPLVVAFLVSILLIMGYFISPRGAPSAWGHINRGIGAFTVWVVAVICYQFIRNKLQVWEQQKVLRRSRDELEERTVELERRNRDLQDFAFIAAHDLSEPLRKIQTLGSLLEAKGADRLSEQERDYVSRMTGAASRMQEQLDALLRYTSVDRKGQEFKPAKLDDAVRDAASDLESAVRQIGACVEIGPLPTVNGDPYQLRQLFQNLIENAVKYHRPDIKPLIKIHGEVIDGRHRISVEDNGIGFEEKYLEKIFQPFQRLHRKNEYSGTGIGLAICKKIIERHGGTITAKSAPGKGSTFIVTLPVEQEGR
jgi:signal transduction histidine kinase